MSMNITVISRAAPRGVRASSGSAAICATSASGTKYAKRLRMLCRKRSLPIRPRVLPGSRIATAVRIIIDGSYKIPARSNANHPARMPPAAITTVPTNAAIGLSHVHRNVMSRPTSAMVTSSSPGIQSGRVRKDCAIICSITPA